MIFSLSAPQRISISIWFVCNSILAGTIDAEELPYLTCATPITLLSANDGAVMKLIEPSLESETKDSITVIQLGPDHPPKVRTVYGTVPNTIGGPPHMAIANNGRFGFVTNHPLGFAPDPDPKGDGSLNAVTIIDLATPSLEVVKQIVLPPHPVMADTHPDGKRVLVGGGFSFHVLTVSNESKRVTASKYELPIFVTGFDISPLGDRIIATGTATPRETSNRFLAWDAAVHTFAWTDAGVQYEGKVGDGEFTKPLNGPFSPRFDPSGRRAYVLNGLGISPRGELDDLVVIDLSTKEPEVTGVVRQLGDGLESLAVHPSGEMVVVSCLDGVSYASHLAVIDVSVKPPQLLYHLPVQPVPEGIEFSPDGRKLFLGCTGAHHIKVFNVIDGNKLVQSPYVIHTGHCPASLALSD